MLSSKILKDGNVLLELLATSDDDLHFLKREDITKIKRLIELISIDVRMGIKTESTLRSAFAAARHTVDIWPLNHLFCNTFVGYLSNYKKYAQNSE